MSGNPWSVAGESQQLWPGLSLRAGRFDSPPWLQALAVAFVLLSIIAAPAGAAQNAPDRELAAAFQLPQLPQLPGLSSVTGPSADW
ncbi:MAG TPA: hypothetical protein VKR81_11050, partial [Candidatus Binatia bacterium]|nr:hypothetical protein [Candidatus Binatia bacterium]